MDTPPCAPVRRGRPPLPPDRRRSERLRDVRLTRRERELFDQLRERRGLSEADLVRDLILSAHAAEVSKQAAA